MQVLSGTGVSNGIAVGKIFYINKSSENIAKKTIYDVSDETRKLSFAIEKAIAQLEELKIKTEKTADKSSSMIFDTHIIMLSDTDFIGEIERFIASNKVCAEYAVSQISKNYADDLKNNVNPYMQERANDVKDISERLINILTGKEYSANSNSSIIIAADDLSPSETAGFDRNHVLGFMIRNGSATSHTSILAKTMDIPAVVNIGDSLDISVDGKTAYIDGFEGKIYIQPDSATLEMLEQRRKINKARNEYLSKFKGKENITKNGQKVKLYGNISIAADVDNIIRNDAEGIGLFRSEFLYMDRITMPTEDELFEVYKTIAQKMNEKPVIIRTLDIGADKQSPAFELPKEDNPALGWRAIRICLDRPDIFQTQIRAIYRASAFGNIYIMLPMITSVDEVIRTKSLILETFSDLKSANIEYKEIPIGIMIETPAAALISDELAKYVDFFSVGSNDLCQYTLAADRQNPKLTNIYDVHHPAVLKLIKLASDNIHREGKWIGICGEAAADKDLIKSFLAMGIDELSVSSGYLLPVKELILNTDLSDYKTPENYALNI